MTRGLVRESEKVACHHPELTEGTEKNSCLGCLKQDYDLSAHEIKGVLIYCVHRGTYLHISCCLRLTINNICQCWLVQTLLYLDLGVTIMRFHVFNFCYTIFIPMSVKMYVSKRCICS